MLFKSFLGLLLILSCCVAKAQNTAECACCTSQHQQFDFWLGEWEVFSPEGKLLGVNKIEKLEDNCLLNETWKGATGFTGRSYNYYNPSDSTWNQTWVDNKGGHLQLKGKATKNSMTLKSDLLRGEKIDLYRNRIIWTSNPDGTVTQVWDILDKDNKVVSEVFRGVYKRKK